METEDTDIEVAADGNPILGQFSEEGFVDCTFRILDLVSTPGGHRFHLSASHEGAVVGFDVVVVQGIQGGFDDNMDLIPDHVYRRGVQFLRSGPESDHLIAVLSELYGVRGRTRRMVESFSFTAIALHQHPVAADAPTIKIKLFGNDGEDSAEDDYFESFFNLSLQSGFVFWNEKDPDYRDPLIRALSGAGGDFSGAG